MTLDRDQRKQLVVEIADVVNAWADGWGIDVSSGECVLLAEMVVDSDPVLDLFRIQAQMEVSVRSR